MFTQQTGGTYVPRSPTRRVRASNNSRQTCVCPLACEWLQQERYPLYKYGNCRRTDEFNRSLPSSPKVLATISPCARSSSC